MALTDGLVAYWKLDGDSTDSVASFDGSDTTITYSAGNGKINNGAGFGGSSEIDFGDSSSFTFTNEIMSVSLWMKAATGHTANRAFMLMKSNWTSGVYEWAIFNDNADHAQFQCYTSAGSAIMTAISTTDVFDDAWHHVVAVADGSKGYIYVDDSEESGGGVSFTGGMSDTAAVMKMGIGTGLTPGYTGALDEVGLWSRALSSTEVTQLYNSGDGLSYDNFTAAFTPKIIFFN